MGCDATTAGMEEKEVWVGVDENVVEGESPSVVVYVVESLVIERTTFCLTSRRGCACGTKGGISTLQKEVSIINL